MTTLNQIANNILNKLSGGRSTHNEYISLDQIKFNVDYYRSLIIHRDLERSVLEQNSFYQTIDVDFTDEGDNTFKSTEKLPNIVRLSHRFPIYINKDQAIPITIGNSIRYMDYNKYTSDDPRAYMLDDHLFIKNYDATDSLEIRAIFETPSEAYMFNGNDPLDVDDMRYPISSDVLQRLSESLISGDMELILQTPSDLKHNTMPDRQMRGES